MKKINLTESQAKELYYNINNFKLFLNGAEQVDKCYFKTVKFWTPTLNNHMKKARESIEVLQKEFDRHFKPKDNDLIEFDAPSELFRVLDFFGRLHPKQIDDIMTQLENEKV